MKCLNGGSILFNDKDLSEMDAHERARAGLFLAFQYPVEIAGISNMYFLKAAVNAIRENQGKEQLDAMEFIDLIEDKKKLVKIRDDLLERAVNSGFSGGEKKRNEIFQMAMLEPKMAILDETDSGLDIDALRIVADGVNALRNSDRGFSSNYSLSEIIRIYRARFCSCFSKWAHRKIWWKGTCTRIRRERL